MAEYNVVGSPCKDQLDVCILQHQRQASNRIVLVQGHIGPTGLQDPESPDQNRLPNHCPQESWRELGLKNAGLADGHGQGGGVCPLGRGFGLRKWGVGGLDHSPAPGFDLGPNGVCQRPRLRPDSDLQLLQYPLLGREIRISEGFSAMSRTSFRAGLNRTGVN